MLAGLLDAVLALPISGVREKDRASSESKAAMDMRPRFIAVVHTWFTSSYGFQVYELTSRTAEEADIQAALLYRKHNEPMVHAAVKVIEIKHNETIGRRLTWWERLTGRIQCVDG